MFFWSKRWHQKDILKLVDLYNLKEKSFRPFLFCEIVMALENSYLTYMRLRKNFGAILHPRVRNILSHELATNTI